MVVVKKSGGKLIANQEQLALGDLLGKRLVIELSIGEDCHPHIRIDNFQQLTDTLDEFEVGDIVRITFEKVGRKIDARTEDT